MELATQSRHARRKQRTRDQLKASAAALLVEKGYEALTIQDITDRVDLARATFYIHFRDKDDAIWAVVQDSFDELSGALVLELTKTPRSWHFQKLVRVFQYAEQNRGLLTAILGERGHIGLLRRLANYLAQFIQRDLDTGLMRSQPGVPADFAAQFMAGATIQVLSWWLKQPTTYTPEEIAALFYALEVQVP